MLIDRGVEFCHICLIVITSYPKVFGMLVLLLQLSGIGVYDLTGIRCSAFGFSLRFPPVGGCVSEMPSDRGGFLPNVLVSPSCFLVEAGFRKTSFVYPVEMLTNTGRFIPDVGLRPRPLVKL